MWIGRAAQLAAVRSLNTFTICAAHGSALQAKQYLLKNYDLHQKACTRPNEGRIQAFVQTSYPPWSGDPPSPVTVQWTTEGRWGKTGLDQSSTCPPHRPSGLGTEDPHPLALRVLSADCPPGLPNGTVQSVPRCERRNRNTTQGVRWEISSQRLRRLRCKYTSELTGAKTNMMSYL